MNLVKLDSVPANVTSQLTEGEEVYYFSYITFEGGCGSSSPRAEHWIAITNDRVLYKTNINENNKMVTRDGIIPIRKISFMEVTEVTQSGCSSKKGYALRISSSGGVIAIPIPTKQKALEIRKVYSEISKQGM